MIDLLDHAAASGVEVDLIVRGMCGLLPDKKRHSGRLRIRSIVGELLEHSRIYRFAIDGSVEILAGSADLMDRNLDRRVEVLFPLLDPESQRRAEIIIATLLADTRNSWILQPDGAWLRSEEINPATPERSAFKELKLAASNSHEAA
jgi:polyphosphate kinase